MRRWVWYLGFGVRRRGGGCGWVRMVMMFAVMSGWEGSFTFISVWDSSFSKILPLFSCMRKTNCRSKIRSWELGIARGPLELRNGLYF